MLSDADRRWAGSRSFVDVAELTLTAWGFEGFVGRKGDHAVKLRKELSDAVLLYAEALHTADMLAFIGEKLTTLYAAIMHSMPVYRLHPATSEREAIELWWPWGRPPPLVDGGPARPSKARKKVLDPRIITATRPQDVVREVMQRTSINRTTARR